MYQTLTRGYGMMAPQTWMVPRRSTTLIHYIRETFVKPDNPTQYTAAGAEYLARLPAGTSLRPAAGTVEPWAIMDYGPSLPNTYEVGGPGPNIAYKAIAIRLDAGAGGVSRGHRWAAVRPRHAPLAAAWSGTGFIDWKGIHFNGQHQVHPKLVGRRPHRQPARARDGPTRRPGRFDDPRLTGRDGRRTGRCRPRLGPIPGRRTSSVTGRLSQHRRRGGRPRSVRRGDRPGRPERSLYSRTLEIGRVAKPLTARIAPAPVGVATVGPGPVKLARTNGASRCSKSRPRHAGVRVKVLMAREGRRPGGYADRPRRSRSPGAADRRRAEAVGGRPADRDVRGKRRRAVRGRHVRPA